MPASLGLQEVGTETVSDAGGTFQCKKLRIAEVHSECPPGCIKPIVSVRHFCHLTEIESLPPSRLQHQGWAAPFCLMYQTYSCARRSLIGRDLALAIPMELAEEFGWWSGSQPTTGFEQQHYLQSV